MKKTYIINIIVGKRFPEDTINIDTYFDFIFDKVKTADNDYYVFGAISDTQQIKTKDLQQIIAERRQLLIKNNYIVYEITAEKGN